MKKYKKKEILGTIRTLEDVNNFIGESNNGVDPANLLDVLTQCQEAAIHLGSYIETLGEKAVYLVEILEDYCENLYQISIALSEQDDSLCRTLTLEIRSQLIRLSDGVRDGLPDDKKEVVFLPYKASMWDSLESVWKAADEDENCDAYVIPIPYYDKNPDGSFREMHYEGDQYPAYVPITKYDEYDMGERRPDMIFIHNPYDECNYVTSVHPFFYSKNLKKFTENLVYIPYFILGEIKPENQAAVDSMSHFCTVPGVFNANKVIVQSEDMRQVYINVLLKETGSTEVLRQYWENKILGLGSPKVDMVLNTRKEDLFIPEEWLRIIKKSDGSWKKIIFYNTTVAALLKNSEQMLIKIESVFVTFKENKDEVALLWRPHPLVESTLISMRPQLWEQYKIIRDRYISEAWGIYDDTADMDRAIAVCDAYYGDSSSLVQLCRKIGKPVMLQNVFVHNVKDDSALLIAEDCIQIDGKLLFVARDVNVIFSLDLKNGEIKLMDSIPEEDFFSNRLSAKIVRWKQQLLFVPFNAKKIWIYHQDTREWNGLLLKLVDNKDIPLKMFQAIPYQNKIFLVGSNYPAIVCVDMETEMLTYFDRVYDCLEDRRKDLGDCYVRCDYVQINDCFYMASALANKVLKFDMSNCQYLWAEVGNDTNRYSGIVWDGSNFWLAPRQNTAIVKWDGEREVAEYPLPSGFEKECIHFLGAVYDGIQIIMPGMEGSKTIRFTEKYAEIPTVWSEQYSFYKRINDNYIVSQTVNGYLEVLDVNGKTERYLCATDTKGIDYSNHNLSTSILNTMQKKTYIENQIINLDDLFKVVDGKKTKQKEDEICGRKIWSRMKTV